MRAVPDWDTYFMNIAKAVSERSKDLSTQVGCIIVNDNKQIISCGYNGMLPGCIETPELWASPEKYKWVIHSEINALQNSTQSVRGCTLFTTMYPCENCAKSIGSAGIKKVVYLDDKYKNYISERILKEMSNIELVQLKE